MTESQAQRLDELQPDALFKHYHLLEQIGLGGQGVVWSALDTAGDRLVAVKFNEAAEEEESERAAEFEQQARLLASLSHPSILPLYDFGQSGKMRYLVSPYVAGGSLRDWLEAAPLSHADILRVTAEIVSALEYLHSRNVVHRDLKPSNIFLDFDRHAYLADFGLARVISATTVALHTGRGTLPYAPPEQHSLAELTPQSDIYSLGVMLYEMFTRHLPWHGEKTLGVQQLHTDDALPDPIDSTPDAPRELAAVLRTLTAANPAQRPRSAAEAYGLIRAVLSNGRASQAGAMSPALDTPEAKWRNAQTLLERGTFEWKLSGERFPLTFTKFVSADLGCASHREPALNVEQRQFMLAGALTFEYHLEYWWNKVAVARDRLEVCTRLIEEGNLIVIARVIDSLYDDLAKHGNEATLSPSAVTALIDFAARVSDLSDRVLRLLRALTTPAHQWQAEGFGQVEDQTLAALAMSEGPQAAEAARLIAHARSGAAVQKIIDEADDVRVLPALIEIQQSAGSLPPSVSAAVRAQVFGEALLRQLAAEPRALIRAFGSTALGGLVGFGAQVYIAYRLPAFIDAKRILIGLERGLFLGLLVGAGLFLARLIVQRWLNFALMPRIAAATVLGGLVINSTLFLYSLLFLDRAPEGWLITLGSAIMAC